MDNLLNTKSHIITPRSTRRVMIDILIALAPATIAAIVLFGAKAAVIISLCVSTSIFSEFVFNLLAKRQHTVTDLTAVVTGLLLALNLSTNVTIWQCFCNRYYQVCLRRSWSQHCKSRYRRESNAYYILYRGCRRSDDKLC